MRFEISGFVTDNAIGCAVAFVEAVTCEFLEQIEDGVCFFLRNFVRARTAFDEIFSFLRHLLLVLFSHRAPEKIGLCK